ncbi:395_t:CDS:2, partial [Funneliformis geosporum]
TADVKSFCKCVCAENSTIVSLSIDQTCSDCNRANCIDQMKDNCAGARNEEGTSKEGCEIQVTATCFQRDSYKDEVIVYLYIIITSGLLLTALTKTYIEKWWKKINSPYVYSSMQNS